MNRYWVTFEKDQTPSVLTLALGLRLLQNSPVELRVPLGSSEIAWRCLKSVRLGPPWAPERMANPADFQPARVASPDFHPD